MLEQRPKLYAGLVALAVVLLLGACRGEGAVSTPTPGPPATPTPTATPTPSPVPTEEPTPTTVPTPTAAPSPPTSTPTAAPTSPPVTAPARIIAKGDSSRQVVSLTFDAGSDRGYTEMILDTLRDNGVRASWGMTGRWAEQNPDLIRRIADEGHDFINHSYDHGSFTGLSTGGAPLTRAQRWEQLDRTEAVIHELTGMSTKPYFRPPFGDYDASVNEDIGARGYRYNVMWTVDSRGWMGLSADAIVDRCLELHEPGAIYIFHVGSASEDGPALQRIIDGLREHGYAFETVAEIVR